MSNRKLEEFACRHMDPKNKMCSKFTCTFYWAVSQKNHPCCYYCPHRNDCKNVCPIVESYLVSKEV